MLSESKVMLTADDVAELLDIKRSRPTPLSGNSMPSSKLKQARPSWAGQPSIFRIQN